MKICLSSETFLPIVDGVGRVVAAYADSLGRMGHEVTVVAPMTDSGYRGNLPYEIVDFNGIGVPGIEQYRTGKPVMDAHYRRRMRMIKLDICHAHSPFLSGTEAIRIAARNNLPLVGTFHSKYYDDFLKVTKSEQLSKIALKYVVNFYKQCDEVWAVNASTAETLRGYGYDGEIQVMPNGVAMREADPAAIEETEIKYNLGHKPMLLFVGQMNWKKNILRVLEAAALLHNEGRQFSLVLAGQGPDYKEIGKKVEQLGLTAITHLAGHITDARMLDALYARASLFVFPSLYDNAPMVVREAAVMRTPSILVHGSCAAENIQDRENGFLCEDDTRELHDLIDSVLMNKSFLDSVGQRAHETIPMSWDDIMMDALDRYQNLIDLGKAGKLRHKTNRLI